MPRPLRWTEDELREAVASSRTLLEVCRRLGISVGGGTYTSLRGHIARLGIDDSHLPQLDGSVRRRRAWTDQELADVVRVSSSLSEVQRRLGYRPSGGMHRYVSAHIKRVGLSTDHFTGVTSRPVV